MQNIFINLFIAKKRHFILSNVRQIFEITFNGTIERISPEGVSRFKYSLKKSIDSTKEVFPDALAPNNTAFFNSLIAVPSAFQFQ